MNSISFFSRRFKQTLFIFIGLIAFCSAKTLNEISTQSQSSEIARSNSAVTYALDYVGRFGDQLSNYIRSYYIAWKYDLTFFYKPFDFSDQLALSKTHIPLTDETFSQYTKIFNLNNDSCYDSKLMNEVIHSIESKENNTLYLIPFHFPSAWEWDEEAFHLRLSELIQPLKPLKLTPVPRDCISVAVHVRSRNNTFDNQNHVKIMPSKFPPLSFYMSALKEILNIFADKSLYFYIFTDDPNPIGLRNKFYEELIQINKKIVMECRLTENAHNKNVLEDFFSMLQFDCLIYPSSAYSLCAAAISAPMVEITTPGWNVYSKDVNGNIIIDNLVKIRPEKRKKIIKRYIKKGPQT